jgi:hypothetical protein
LVFADKEASESLTRIEIGGPNFRALNKLVSLALYTGQATTSSKGGSNRVIFYASNAELGNVEPLLKQIGAAYRKRPRAYEYERTYYVPKSWRIHVSGPAASAIIRRGVPVKASIKHLNIIIPKHVETLLDAAVKGNTQAIPHLHDFVWGLFASKGVIEKNGCFTVYLPNFTASKEIVAVEAKKMLRLLNKGLGVKGVKFKFFGFKRTGSNRAGVTPRFFISTRGAARLYSSAPNLFESGRLAVKAKRILGKPVRR